MPVHILKRLLPFALTVCASVLISNLALVLPAGAGYGTTPAAADAGDKSFSFYSEQCRCMIWTTERKRWVEIKDLPRPRFTEAARRQRFTGAIQARVLLGANGRVLEVKPYAPLPYGLNGEVIRAAQSIRFNPASMFFDLPESVWVTVGYSFATVNNGLHDTYQTEVEVFDHYDVNMHGLEIRMERAKD